MLENLKYEWINGINTLSCREVSEFIPERSVLFPWNVQKSISIFSLQ
jgi:hypothetical protein